MGACVSTQQGCVGGRFKKKNRKRKRIIGFRRRVSSQFSSSDNNKVDLTSLPQHSFSNPTFQGSCYSFFSFLLVFLFF